MDGVNTFGGVERALLVAEPEDFGVVAAEFGVELAEGPGEWLDGGRCSFSLTSVPL